MKYVKYLFFLLMMIIMYVVIFPSSCITWFANRERLYRIEHNGYIIDIFDNPGNATNANYLQIEINGRIKRSEKTAGVIGKIIIEDSTLQIFVKPIWDNGYPPKWNDTICQRIY